MNPQSKKTCTTGAALIEFALLLPVLITLTLGTIEAGWALYVQNSLVDAAREGARIAVTKNISTNTIISNVSAAIDNSNLPSAAAGVIINPINISLQPKGTLITVTVSLPYNNVSILPTPLFLGNLNLQASVTMAKEY